MEHIKFDCEVESKVAAAVSKSLMKIKDAVRSKGYPEEEKDLLCRLFDNAFRAGFSVGAIAVAEHLLEKMP